MRRSFHTALTATEQNDVRNWCCLKMLRCIFDANMDLFLDGMVHCEVHVQERSEKAAFVDMLTSENHLVYDAKQFCTEFPKKAFKFSSYFHQAIKNEGLNKKTLHYLHFYIHRTGSKCLITSCLVCYSYKTVNVYCTCIRPTGIRDDHKSRTGNIFHISYAYAPFCF